MNHPIRIKPIEHNTQIENKIDCKCNEENHLSIDCIKKTNESEGS